MLFSARNHIPGSLISIPSLIPFAVVSGHVLEILSCMFLLLYFSHAGLGVGLVIGTKCSIISTLFS